MILARPRFLLVFVIFALLFSSLRAEPMVPALQRYNADLDASAHGKLLMAELNCAACHTVTSAKPKQAPILTDVSSRVKPQHLYKFLTNPAKTKPGTTMPNLFHGKPEAQVREEVDALVHFLGSLGPGKLEYLLPSASSRARGEQLYHRSGCVACHDPRKEDAAALPTSKPLGDLSGKYTLDSLATFLRDPLHVRPSGRMPSLNLSGRDATSIAAYLLPELPARAGITWALYKGSWNQLPDFDKLKPAEVGDAEVIDVNVKNLRENFGLRFEGVLPVDQAGTYTFYIHSDDGSRIFVNDQKVVDNDGIHAGTEKSGKIELQPGKYPVVVEFFEKSGEEVLRVQYEGPGISRSPLHTALLAGGGTPEDESAAEGLVYPDDPAKVARGRQLFASLGCANCHEANIDGKRIVSSLAKTNVSNGSATNGCLSKDVPAKAAQFDLSSSQQNALRAALKNGAPLTITETMLSFNCVACHQRGELGGVEQERKAHFTTTQPEMGIEGSIPPGLNGVGAKLTATWLADILNKGAKDRPYMLTQMPRFGTPNVGHLVSLLEKEDLGKPLPKLDLSSSREVKQHGAKLVGAKGLSCIKCHTFGRFKATGVQSIDMTIMTKRLREDWFRRYIRNPGAFRRGTRMPAAWPPAPNKSFLPDILDGDSDKQIQAVWYYLADGTRARIPSGLVTNSMELIPTDEALIYRNFIEGAGSRAIGVGYPEALNLAFDANEMRVALIWQGAFMDAKRHWSGRGQGFQPPAGEKVQKLVGGVPFARLETADAAWPNQSARDLGYRFRGYQLTEDGRPTFIYDFDGVRVEEFPDAVTEGTDGFLVRKFKITGNVGKSLFFRVANGSVTELGDGKFSVGDMEMTFESANKPVIRGQELLIPVTAAGTIVQTIGW